MKPIAENITIITPSIVSRLGMLQECIESVAAQTMLPKEHIIEIDYGRIGCYPMVNRLIDKVKTEYVQFLSDDNLLKPTYLETIAQHLPEHDLVYAFVDVTPGHEDWNAHFTPDRLRQSNFIGEPCIRTQALRDAGPFDAMDCRGDWRMYLQLLDRGCSFQCVPERLVVFRYGHGNYSTGDLPAVP